MVFFFTASFNYCLGSKEEGLAKSGKETDVVADSGGILRQAVNGWRKQDRRPSGLETAAENTSKDDIEGSSSSASPEKTVSTGRDLHEIILSPAG